MYVPLDVNFPDDDKVIEVGLNGAGLYAMSLCLAKRLLSDGVLSRPQLRRLGGSDDLIDHLVTAGLYADHANGCVRICAWLSHNRSAEDIESASLGKPAAHVRWHVNRGVVSEDCELCQATKPHVDASGCDADADASTNADAAHMPEGETETEGEPEADVQATSGQLPQVLAKRACLVLAQRAVSRRIDNGEVISSPAQLAKYIATTDLWPLLEIPLTKLATEHPDQSPDVIADAHEPPAIDVKGIAERADADWRERAKDEPPLVVATELSVDGLAAARDRLKAASRRDAS